MTKTLEQEQADNKARMQVMTEELQAASDAEDDVRRSAGGHHADSASKNLNPSPVFTRLGFRDRKRS